MHMPLFVLIHAPLVGPMIWSPVAAVLRKQGYPVSLPVLTSARVPERLFWQQHAAAVAAAVEKTASEAARANASAPRIVLVAHSGAGPLLPAARQAIGGLPVAAHILVDALFPLDGLSRLELFESEWAAEEFRRSAQDGLLPVWTETDLSDVISDDALRRGFVEELRPLPLAVYEEPLPVYSGWPDAPAAYLRFGENPAYDLSFRRAREAGCLAEQIDGQHFEMLEHPRRVAGLLVDLARRLGLPVAEEGSNA